MRRSALAMTGTILEAIAASYAANTAAGEGRKQGETKASSPSG